MRTIKKYMSNYPIPSITTTAVIATDEKVLLIKRGKEPFKDQWAFAGGFFNEFESAKDCCVREVKEETGLDIAKYMAFDAQPLAVISNKQRDPRGWVVDCPFFVRLPYVILCSGGDDASEAQWFDVKEVDTMKLAFDHSETWRTVRLRFFFKGTNAGVHY